MKFFRLEAHKEVAGSNIKEHYIKGQSQWQTKC
jgi:hypothetical protein